MAVLLAAGAPLVCAAEAVVAVAVSLRAPLREIAERVAPLASGDTVLINAGASSVLLQQARRGAPVDLFVSASPAELDRLDEAGLLRPGTRRDIAANRLVLVAPAPGPAPAELSSLSDPRWSRIAVGNPATAPLGRYTAQTLAAAGLDDALAPRLVVGESARHVIDWVARGEVDAGIVYASDASRFAGRVVDGGAIDDALHRPIVYQAAVMRNAAAPELALRLLDALGTEEGRRVLARHGFAPPP